MKNFLSKTGKFKRFNSNLKEGIDFIAPKKIKQDFVNFAKMENFELEKKLLKQEKILNEEENEELKKWKAVFSEGEDKQEDFEFLYKFLSKQELQTKMNFLNFLKEMDREDVVIQIETLYIKRMLLEANRNIEFKRENVKEPKPSKPSSSS
jgi:hypothetical protein